jgi:hypothetical protein
MTNSLTDVREALAEALTTAGFRSTAEVPQTFSPPLCWVAPRAPYRRPGQTFGLKRVSLAVVCLAAQGTNAVALEQVDQLASDVADAIEAMAGFRLDAEEIDAPQLFPSAQGQEYLGAVVNVICDVARA